MIGLSLCFHDNHPRQSGMSLLKVHNLIFSQLYIVSQSLTLNKIWTEINPQHWNELLVYICTKSLTLIWNVINHTLFFFFYTHTNMRKAHSSSVSMRVELWSPAPISPVLHTSCLCVVDNTETPFFIQTQGRIHPEKNVSVIGWCECLLERPQR